MPYLQPPHHTQWQARGRGQKSTKPMRAKAVNTNHFGYNDVSWGGKVYKYEDSFSLWYHKFTGDTRPGRLKGYFRFQCNGDTRRRSLYRSVMVGGQYLRIPATPKERGTLPLCDQCKHQLMCVAGKNEHGTWSVDRDALAIDPDPPTKAELKKRARQEAGAS